MRNYNTLRRWIMLTACVLMLAIAPAALAADYALWVNGIQVTAANKDNVLGFGSGVSFAPATRTLTFADKATLTTTHNGYAIYSALGETLTVELNKFSNKIPSIYSDSGIILKYNNSGPMFDCDVRLSAGDNISIDTGSGFIAVGGTQNLVIERATNVEITGNCGNYLIQNATISASGDVSLTNLQGYVANGDLVINSANNVTVTGNYQSPTINGDATINARGEVSLTNKQHSVVGGKLVINGAKNVTVDGSSTDPIIGNGADIAASGNVEIINTDKSGTGVVVYTLLKITGAKNVTVTGNNNGSIITGPTNITASGDVSLTNNAGYIVSDNLVVKGAKDVTITASHSEPIATGGMDIAASSAVTLINSGSGSPVGNDLTVSGKGQTPVVSGDGKNRITITDGKAIAYVSTDASGAASSKWQGEKPSDYDYHYVKVSPCCTVTWKNDDGKVLKTDDVLLGETPAYDGEAPTKAADAQYTYAFEGWTPDVIAVTGDVTYTATYTAVPIPTDNLPKTGDDSRLALWLTLAALSCAGALAISRRKNHANE